MRERADRIVAVAGGTPVEAGFFDQPVERVVGKVVAGAVFVEQGREPARAVVFVAQARPLCIAPLQRQTVGRQGIGGAGTERVGVADEPAGGVVVKTAEPLRLCGWSPHGLDFCGQVRPGGAWTGAGGVPIPQSTILSVLRLSDRHGRNKKCPEGLFDPLAPAVACTALAADGAPIIWRDSHRYPAYQPLPLSRRH